MCARINQQLKYITLAKFDFYSVGHTLWLYIGNGNGCHRITVSFIVQDLLTVDDLYDVLDQLHEVRAKWYDLGGSLELRASTLDAIKVEHHNAPDVCLRQTISHWLRQVTPRPCWNAIVFALRKPIVNEPRLAETLETKYCSGMYNITIEKLV